MTNLRPGYGHAEPEFLFDLNGTLVFGADTGTAGLFRSDGTAAGTERLANVDVWTPLTGVGGDRAFFGGPGGALWVTDGTTGGSRRITTLGSASIERIVELDGAAYAAGSSGYSTQFRLTRSDGTPAGTQTVAAVPEYALSSKDHQLTRVGGDLYFLGYTASDTFDLYRYDGATGVAASVHRFNRTTFKPSNLFAYGGWLYVTASENGGARRLYRTDGTTLSAVTDAAGATITAGAFVAEHDGLLYFESGDGWMWRSDGTPAGTVRIPASAQPGGRTAVLGGALYGVADELVRLTPTGGEVVAEINPTGSASPGAPVAAGGRLYFPASDAIGDRELWRSDGTAAGTVREANLSGYYASMPRELAAVNGTVFFTATDDAAGAELFALTTAASAPLGLRATARSDARVDLSWGFPVGGDVTGFRVERSADGGATFAQVAQLDGAGATSYADAAGLSPATRYVYRVRATTAAGGDTPYSGTATATTQTAVPPAPTSLTAAAVPGSSTSVGLAWVDQSGHESGFRVYRSDDPSPTRVYQLVHTAPADATAHVDEGLAPGTAYYYQVTAFNGAGESAPAADPAQTYPAQAPYGGGSGGAGVGWAVPGAVEAEDYDAGGHTIAFFDNTGANLGGRYRPAESVDVYDTTDPAGGAYHVAALTGEWLEYTLDVPADAAGTYHLELRVAAGGPADRVHVSVDGVAAGAADVPYAPGAGIGDLPAFRTVSASDLTLAAGERVLRVLVETPGGGPPVRLNALRLTRAGTVAPPVAPAGLSASPLPANAVELTWANTSDEASGFAVERRTAGGGGGAWAVIGTADAQAARYVDATVAPETAYAYRVRATGAAGASPPSTEAAASTLASELVLVKDLTPGPTWSGPRYGTTVVDGTAYLFTADGGFWRSDGTPDGTARLLPAGSLPVYDAPTSEVVGAGGLVFFTPARPASQTRGLYVTDGTAPGTRQLTALPSPHHLTPFGGALYTLSAHASYPGIWKSDGTDGGTTRVQALPAGTAGIHAIGRAGDALYFTTWAEGGHRKLWRTDGSPDAAALVADLPTPPGGSFEGPTFLRAYAGLMLFNTVDATGYHSLWRTDGTAAGTFKLGGGNVWSTVELDGAVYFTSNEQDLWRTDGTAAGTSMVKRFARPNGTGYALQRLSAFRDALYFGAHDDATGYELWRSDGTADGTALLKDLLPGPATANAALRVAVAGDTLFFTAHGGAAAGVWRTDGTAAGTRMVGAYPANTIFSADALTAFGPDLLLAYRTEAEGMELYRAYGQPPAPALGAVRYADGVRLTWDPRGAGSVDRFEVERRAAPNVAWERIAVVGPDTTEHTDAAAAAGHPYAYRVRVVARGGEAYAAEVTATDADPRPAVWSVAPNDGDAQRSVVTGLTVTFDRPVALDPGAFALTRDAGPGGGEALAGITVRVAPSEDARTFALTFDGPGLTAASLPDGVYRLTVAAAAVHAHTPSGPTMAGDVTRAFHRLFSDADGDGDSDAADLSAFRTSLNKARGQSGYLWYLDHDDDGVVDAADLAQTRARRSVVYAGY